MSESAEQPIGSPAAASTYRCFLFADLRGYTALIERAGNAAGVQLLEDYLRIVRAAVAKYDGAEIKVEGDGFHAVFPSASSAVMCGIEICHAASTANADRPDLPIAVGIGIHAGEALETADGYIGSAVNIAARVCAAALSGEVLVTSTVRGITQASIPVVFTSRGRKRLKGIADPIEVFAVTSEGVAPPRVPVDRRRWLSAAAAIGGIALAVAALLVLFRPFDGLGSGPTPGPSNGATPLEQGPLEPGHYFADSFIEPFTFEVTNPDWLVNQEDPELVSLQYSGENPGFLDAARIDEVYPDLCNEEPPLFSAGDTPTDLIGALVAAAATPEGQTDQLFVSQPRDITIGELSGKQVDVEVLAGAVAACSGAAEVNLFTVAGEPWTVPTDRRLRITVLDVDGTPITFIQQPEGGGDTPNPVLEGFYEESGRVVDSVRF